MAERPARGLADVVAAATAISAIDGQAGRLSYRGYDIGELAGRASFEEVSYLLQRGTAPGGSQLDGYLGELAAGRALGPLAAADLAAVAGRQRPMEALRSLVSLASADDPDARSSDRPADLRKAARLTAKQPVLIAAYQAARSGRDLPLPDPGLSIAANFLLQLTGEPPERRRAEILDTCLVLHADHALTASTFAARICAATLADLHSAIVAALATLQGPLHAGATEQVMLGLEKLRAAGGDPLAEVSRYVTERLGRGEKVMGFGHRVYQAPDPRAGYLRQLSSELGASSGDDLYYRMSRRMEEVVLERKGLYPNADFYAATVYHYLGIPADLGPAVLSASRMAGWTAHVIEQHADNRLIRPESEYVGESGRHWLPLAAR
jgi:citrate synthase